jgi:PLP dependent protein
MSIASNLVRIKNTLPQNVALVAVSKTKPVADLWEAYQVGQRIFGENKIQEMTEKWAQLPKDIQWHMIGHVQRNKVKFMVPFVNLIHGVDSLNLLEEINKQAKKHNRIIDCLLQLHIASEETKFGLNEVEFNALILDENFKKMQNICVVGLMGMATFTTDTILIADEFKNLKNIFDNHKYNVSHNFELKILSMGMSGDYQIAIENGSNMVRIGSSIFGGR